MKILHIFRNASFFFKNEHVATHSFNNAYVEHHILDIYKAGDVMAYSVFPQNIPFVRIPYPDAIEDYLTKGESHATLLQIHSQEVFEWVVSKKNWSHPFILHIHRHDIAFYEKLKNSPALSNSFLSHWAGFISPFEEWNDSIKQSHPLVSTALVKEIPRINLNFIENNISEENAALQFGVLLSKWDGEFVTHVHEAVKKILITNRVLNILWILPDKKTTSLVQQDITSSELSEYVTIGRLEDLPMLYFDGLITDGNKSLSFDFFQYFHLLIACIKSQKLIITLKGNPYFIDLLKDGKTCITLPDFQSNKLGHLIHFFIAFPEEIQRVTGSAKAYFDSHFSQNQVDENLLHFYKHLKTEFVT